MGSDAYRHAGALLESIRLGHCINTGGWKSPPPMLTPVQHSADVAVPTQIKQAHIAVQEWGRSEATAFGSGGGKGGNLKGVQRQWDHPQYSCVFQIPGESNICC